MTIVEELKALYVKTGGTAADNGSVLTVVDGAWAAVAPESAQQ